MEKFVAGKIKECCQNEDNLSEPEPTGVEGEVVRRCKVCGCRHFRAVVDTGHLGIVGSGT